MNIDEMKALWERTNQGKNPCPQCGQPKEMYYQPWCPRCDKPEVSATPVLNAIQAFKHIEANGHPGYRDRMQKWTYEHPNDSYFRLWFIDLEELESEQERQDLLLLQETFNLGESVLMFLSW